MLLYHGTDNLSAENIAIYGVDFNKCDPFTDNARGVYLTNNKKFAEVRASVMTFSPQIPVVIEMHFDEESARKKLNILQFDNINDDWRFFVAFNRAGLEHYKLMNSSFPQKINNLTFCYDIVIDVPADAKISSITDAIDNLLYNAEMIHPPRFRNEILKNIKLINAGGIDLESKQYSFHTMQSLNFLKVNRILNVI